MCLEITILYLKIKLLLSNTISEIKTEEKMKKKLFLHENNINS